MNSRNHKDSSSDLDEFAKQMQDMMAGTMSQSAAVGSIMIEATAWDHYVSALLRAGKPVEVAVADASVILAKRRALFGVEALKARVLETLSEKDPQTICGHLLEDSKVCVLDTDHEGGHSPFKGGHPPQGE